MRSTMCKWVSIFGLFLFSSIAVAQIYRCTAADGTPIFSDERCGPDAKVVTGIGSSKRANPAPQKPASETKSPEELRQLLERCDAGDNTACMTWTKSGGTRQLQAQEKQHESACAGGSLLDCEQRYCQDGLSDECRRHVLEVAKLSGANWYLRNQQSLQDGSTRYSLRCLPQASRELRDLTVSCAALAGPNRCTTDGATQGFARLDQVAASSCAAGSTRDNNRR